MTYDIIKLYQRFGATAAGEKPYIIPFYTLRMTVSNEEYTALSNNSGGTMYTENEGWYERATLIKNLIPLARISNNPVYLWRFSYTPNVDGFIDKVNSLDYFYNTDNYVDGPINISRYLYKDLAIDEDFSNIVSSGTYVTSTGGVSSALNYLCYVFNSLTNPGQAVIRLGVLLYNEDTDKLYVIQFGYSSQSTVNNTFSCSSWSAGASLPEITDETAKSLLLSVAPWVEQTDPYAPGGTSGPSSGSGTFDLTSDTISVPNLPTLSAANAGLVTVYVPNATQLNSFASLLFGRTFLDAFLNAITTLFVDPLEAVIGLSIVPVAPTLAMAKQVSVAFIGLTSDDGPLMMQPAATQYVEVDCGTIFIDEFSGSALDYSPYSKFHIYLPYIGTRELSTDEIRNKHLHVVYHIDIVSGSCVALLEVEGSVLYQFAGNCATPIPINGRDFSRMVTAGIQLAASFVGATAGAGVGAVAAGNIGKPDDYISTESSFNTLIKTLDSDEGVTPSANKAAGGKVDAEHLVSSTAGVVAGMKSHIQHASGIGGSAGMLGVQKPYLIAEIPRQSLAADYNKFVGYPSNITSLLGDLTGFTQIEMIHLKGIPCTETELAEIDKMLRNGVIL